MGPGILDRPSLSTVRYCNFTVIRSAVSAVLRRYVPSALPVPVRVGCPESQLLAAASFVAQESQFSPAEQFITLFEPSEIEGAK